jgi:hypothetical protein
MDLRRSGAVEAQAGNVDPTALAAKMANSKAAPGYLLAETCDDRTPRRRGKEALSERTNREEKLQFLAGKVATRQRAEF